MLSKRCIICLKYSLNADEVSSICPVCFWEDDGDGAQSSCGPNGIGVDAARTNYRKYGAVRPDLAKYTRDAYSEEDSIDDSDLAYYLRYSMSAIDRSVSAKSKYPIARDLAVVLNSESAIYEKKHLISNILKSNMGSTILSLARRRSIEKELVRILI